MSKIHICYVRYVDTTLRLFGKKALTKGCKTGVLLLLWLLSLLSFKAEKKSRFHFVVIQNVINIDRL